MKRFLYFLIFLAAIGVVVAGFFFLRYREAPPPQEPKTEETGLPVAPAAPAPEKVSAPAPPAALPPVQLGALRLLYPNPVRDYRVREDGSVLVLETDGKVGETKGNTSNTLSPATIAHLQKTAFSRDSSKILALFGTGAAKEGGIFDIKSKTWQPFPVSVLDAAWSPADLKVAYLIEKAGGASLETLNIADARAKPQELLRTRLQDVLVSWPVSARIMLQSRPSGLVPGGAWVFDIAKKTLTSFAEAQPGLTLTWAKDGKTALAFTAKKSGRGGSLFLVSAQGEIQEGLSFFTLPDKCGFGASTSTVSADTLVCAVPRDPSFLEVSVLPDAYYKRAAFTADDIYAVSLGSGQASTIFGDASKIIDAANLSIAGNAVYFINRYDQKLYSLPLNSK